MEEESHVLIFVDSAADVEIMRREIGELDPRVVTSHAGKKEDLAGAVEAFSPQVILAEEELLSVDGHDPMTVAGELGLDAQIILMAKSWDTERALDALRKGAFDYIPREQVERLGHSVQRALREADAAREREWTEAELFRKEEAFRALIENSSDLFLVTDNQGKMKYISPSVQRILGYDPENLSGELMFDYFHPEEREEALKTFWGIVATPGITPALFFRIAGKNGAWRYLEGNANNLLRNSIISGVVITARDVTERILQARRLQKLNSCFLSLGAHSYLNTRTVIESTREIMQSTIVQYCKKARDGLVFISTKPGEEEFSPVLECKSLPCYQMILDDAEEPLRIDDLRRTDFAAVYQDIIHFGLKTFLAFPVRLDGTTIGSINLFEKRHRDYSGEEMSMLAALAQTIAIEEERLQREEGAREFIDIASHELRHPITLISGYAALLKEGAGELDDEKRGHILDVIFRCSDRLDHLAGELLNVSRIEQGRMPLDIRTIEVEPMIRQVIEDIREIYHDHRFRVSVASDAGRVDADAEGMARLLRELLDNACRYSPGSSQVRVEAEAMGEEVQVTLLDRGQGIPEAYRDKIFNRFYRTGDILHHSRHGLGLGLYIAREITEANGGRLWYEPRPGGGSVFRFTLPRAASSGSKKGTNRIRKPRLDPEVKDGEA